MVIFSVMLIQNRIAQILKKVSHVHVIWWSRVWRGRVCLDIALIPHKRLQLKLVERILQVFRTTDAILRHSHWISLSVSLGVKTIISEK